jgi:hypothetical protein
MSGLGPDLYGEPCRECGFSWTAPVTEVRARVAGLPERLAVLLTGARGDERLPGLDWTVAGYVAHVSDNLRIWAERVAGIVHSGRGTVTPYDQDELARARGYGDLGLAGVLWALPRSVRDWLDALDLAGTDFAMDHPEAGTMSLDDVVLTTAHDALHHEWDIERSLQG